VTGVQTCALPIYAEHVEDIDGASGLEAAVTDGGTAAALVELFTRNQVG
jgi:hypothetical protein